MPPSFPITCTLTGVDEQTRWGDLMALHRDFPFVEFGVLWSPKKQGADPRYPAEGFIREIISRRISIGDAAPPLALHVCGAGVDQAFEEAKRNDGVGFVASVRSGFGRIQLNLRADAYPVEDIRGFIRWAQPAVVITQHNEANEDLWRSLRDLDNHALLHDASLGRGMPPASWFPPLPGRATGYAGGLGPHNVAVEMGRIALVASGKTWIDMESKIRDADDRFDVRACRSVLQDVARFQTLALLGQA